MAKVPSNTPPEGDSTSHCALMAEEAERYALGQSLRDQLTFELHLLNCQACQEVVERTWQEKVLPKLTRFLQATSPQSAEETQRSWDDENLLCSSGFQWNAPRSAPREPLARLDEHWRNRRIGFHRTSLGNESRCSAEGPEEVRKATADDQRTLRESATWQWFGAEEIGASLSSVVWFRSRWLVKRLS